MHGHPRLSVPAGRLLGHHRHRTEAGSSAQPLNAEQRRLAAQFPFGEDGHIDRSQGAVELFGDGGAVLLCLKVVVPHYQIRCRRRTLNFALARRDGVGQLRRRLGIRRPRDSDRRVHEEHENERQQPKNDLLDVLEEELLDRRFVQSQFWLLHNSPPWSRVGRRRCGGIGWRRSRIAWGGGPGRSLLVRDAQFRAVRWVVNVNHGANLHGNVKLPGQVLH